MDFIIDLPMSKGKDSIFVFVDRLTKYANFISIVKEVMQKIKFPTGFCANLKNIITKKGDFAGVKTHDWHVFIKVIIIVMSI